MAVFKCLLNFVFHFLLDYVVNVKHNLCCFVVFVVFVNKTDLY